MLLVACYHSTWPTKPTAGSQSKSSDPGAVIYCLASMLGSKAITGKLIHTTSEKVLTGPRGVGLLKYWTLSNLPLFILAGPMLSILLSSALWAWRQSAQIPQLGREKGHGVDWNKARKGQSAQSSATTQQDILRRLLMPQALLAILALTTYHVQIITRLSSGYPVWYWWLASMILGDRKILIFGKYLSPAKLTVRWMVCYALIQCGLFASFLPPA